MIWRLITAALVAASLWIGDARAQQINYAPPQSLGPSSSPVFTSLGLGGASPISPGSMAFYGGSVGGITVGDNGNNALTVTSGKFVSFTGGGGLLISSSTLPNGVILSSDANNTLTLGPLNAANGNTSLVLQGASASSDVSLSINMEQGTSEERLIWGTDQANSRYILAQVIVGSGVYLPVDFQMGTTLVARMTTGNTMDFANGALRLTGSSSGQSTLEAPASGGGIVTFPSGAHTLAQLDSPAFSGTVSTPALAAGGNSLVQIGQSGTTNGVINLNGLALGSASFNFLGSGGDLFINRPAGNAIHFKEANGSDQITLATGGAVTFSGSLTASGSVFNAAAPTVSAGQVGFGGTVAATGLCGTLSGDSGCLIINVAGTTRYIPYY